MEEIAGADRWCRKYVEMNFVSVRHVVRRSVVQDVMSVFSMF
jgi:hypothetical protein